MFVNSASGNEHDHGDLSHECQSNVTILSRIMGHIKFMKQPLYNDKYMYCKIVIQTYRITTPTVKSNVDYGWGDNDVSVVTNTLHHMVQDVDNGKGSVCVEAVLTSTSHSIWMSI